jgi:hypothetical protein
MRFTVAPIWGRFGWSLLGLAVVVAAAGVLLTWAGMSVVDDVPFYAPFVGASKIIALIGLAMLALARHPEEDEYLERIRLDAFRGSLVLTAVLVLANELVYLWGNAWPVSAWSVVATQLIVFQILFRTKLSMQ